MGLIFRHPFWFSLFRRRFRPKASHRARNRACDEALGDRFVFDQHALPPYAVGRCEAAHVICEIAAAYNARRLLGRPLPLSDVIDAFETRRYLMGIFRGGPLGSDPYAVGAYFADEGIPCTAFRSRSEWLGAQGRRDGVYLISFWNTGRLRHGLHTAAFRYAADGRVLGYNTRPGADAPTVEPGADPGKRFIVGWFLPDH